MAATAIGIQAKRNLDELYRAHAAEVYRYVYAVLGNRADAEDVTQTTFVNALRALERGERPRKPANWLITIAHNLIRQRFRQQQSRPRQVELDRDVPTLEADDSVPSIEDLVRALQRIPETQREALVLREMEGRSYKEISAILDVSETALESLIFRARRSLAEELENLVTCDRAELALSQQTDGRLSRKERKRLVAHLDECPSCSRVATLGLKRRRAFKGLAMLPLPFSLTIFKGAPSASAAIGLPTIGGGAAAGTAAGIGVGGVTAKIAIGLAAVAVAGGAGYEGVQTVRKPATPDHPTQAAPADVVPAVALPVIVRAQPGVGVAKATPEVAKRKAVGKKKNALKKPHPVKRVQGNVPVKGRSATAPGQTKATREQKEKNEVAAGRTNAFSKQKVKSTAPPETKTASPKPKAKAKQVAKKAERAVAKPVPARGKIAVPPDQANPVVVAVDTKPKKTR
jgi:RNA polymerase sigma factor (sigma-70 family)